MEISNLINQQGELVDSIEHVSKSMQRRRLKQRTAISVQLADLSGLQIRQTESVPTILYFLLKAGVKFDVAFTLTWCKNKGLSLNEPVFEFVYKLKVQFFRCKMFRIPFFIALLVYKYLITVNN